MESNLSCATTRTKHHFFSTSSSNGISTNRNVSSTPCQCKWMQRGLPNPNLSRTETKTPNNESSPRDSLKTLFQHDCLYRALNSHFLHMEIFFLLSIASHDFVSSFPLLWTLNLIVHVYTRDENSTVFPKIFMHTCRPFAQCHFCLSKRAVPCLLSTKEK